MSLRIALIGFGYWGPNIAKNIARAKNADLVAICDASDTRLVRAKELFGDSGISYIEDWRALIDDEGVDALAVAAGTEINYQVALAAAKAGKHLFLEKPMCETSAKAREVGRVAAEHGVIVHVDHLMLYNNIIAYIKEMLDSGELGALLYYDCARMNLGPIKKDVNAMWDLAVHDLAVIDYLTDGKTPLAVDAVGGRGYGKQETLTYLTMKYDGFIAHLKSSWLSPIKERRIIIGGTKKLIVFDDVKQIDKLTIYDSGIEVEGADMYGEYEFKVRSGDIRIPYIPFEDSLLTSVEHFADCAISGKTPRSSCDQAARVIEILERAQMALNA